MAKSELSPDDDLDLKTSEDLTSKDDNESHETSIVKALGVLPLETLQYLQALIARNDGRMDSLLAKLIDPYSNIVVDGSKQQQQTEQEPQPSTSKQVYKAVELSDDGDDVITIDEEDDPMVDIRAQSPESAALESFATLQSLFPDLSPTFLQVKCPQRSCFLSPSCLTLMLK